MKWNYRSFKCATAKAAKDKMVETRKDGWQFCLVYKLADGDFMLQVKKKPEGE
jgi:hypothetical protein